MGNWKMHGDRLFATSLADKMDAHFLETPSQNEIVICPPELWLLLVQERFSKSPLKVGAQDCWIKEQGAFTGQVSAHMLKDAGCDYVIVGHSERRAQCGENDSLVKAKAEAARNAGLTPVICVGETLEDRQAGKAIEVVQAQLKGSVPDDASGCVVAYEPVWAIGTGEVPTIDDITAMHAAIHTALAAEKEGDTSLRVLYGGSVKPTNANEILRINGVNGALVGGASLKADSFIAICEAV